MTCDCANPYNNLLRAEEEEVLTVKEMGANCSINPDDKSSE